METEQQEQDIIFESDPMEKLIPQTGFIREYVSFARELTDAPISFHLTVAYSLLSTMTQNASLPFGAQDIKPNLWILLLAPTSFFRKSTSLIIGRRVLEKVDHSLLLPNEFSQEAICDLLSQRAGQSGMFMWSEMGGVLANFEKTYMTGIKEMLSDLFDVPPYYSRQLKKGLVVIEKPYFTILGASSLIWFTEKIKESDLYGGFLTRFLFCLVDKKTDRKSLPQKMSEADQIRLADWLLSISAKAQEMKLSEEAMEFFEKWSFEREDDFEREEQAGQRAVSIFRRSTNHALKIAMLNAMSEGDGIEITKEHIKHASEFVDHLYMTSRGILYPELETNRIMKLANRVKKIVKRHNGIGRARLLQSTHVSARELEEALFTLFSSKELIKVKKEWTLKGTKHSAEKIYLNLEKDDDDYEGESD